MTLGKMKSDVLHQLFLSTRKKTEEICSSLETEDFVVQPVVFVSPPKWHLAHSSWFFEEFVLKKFNTGYPLFDSDFGYLFNSYYEAVGERVCREERGNLSRPTVREVFRYRDHVTRAMSKFLQTDLSGNLKQIILTGIQHEKQHQELLVTDIKYILGHNPLFPACNAVCEEDRSCENEAGWLKVPEGLYNIGHRHPGEFCFDNELESHKVYLQEYEISKGLVTNGEYLEFINAGGYEDVLLWHADGWDWKLRDQIKAPPYWFFRKGKWYYYTFYGLKEVDLEAPLRHISFYEAFAYSQWKGARLPTEFEWEAAQEDLDWGSRWEWTSSAYLPYPGFTKDPGAIGEYNGKFMVNQMVLRGASVASPADHIRPTYRNFFPPETRWQYSGIRLVKRKRHE